MYSSLDSMRLSIDLSFSFTLFACINALSISLSLNGSAEHFSLSISLDVAERTDF